MTNGRRLLLGVLCVAIFCFSAGSTPGQQDDGWMRVVSDDNEFSLEVPARYKFYANKDGFFESSGRGNTSVEQMRSYTAYHNDSLISFEAYVASSPTLDAMFERDSTRNKSAVTSRLKKDNVTVRQLVLQPEGAYMIRQYISVKGTAIILTAASRKGETAEMRRFLDSLKLIKKQVAALSSVKKISELTMTEIEIEMALDSKVVNPPTDRGTLTSQKIVYRPIPLYVDVARRNGVTGIVRLELTCDENGFIPRIKVKETLKDGLLRQSLFAALRIKFLPALKESKPVQSQASLAFSFNIN